MATEAELWGIVALAAFSFLVLLSFGLAERFSRAELDADAAMRSGDALTLASVLRQHRWFLTRSERIALRRRYKRLLEESLMRQARATSKLKENG